MTEQEIFEALVPLVGEVTGTPDENITMDKVLMKDLGAESLDLLDLSFLIEDRFKISIGPAEFEKQVRDRIPGGEYEQDGMLTEAALLELRNVLPEVDARQLVPPLKKTDLPTLLTVSVFVHLVQRKLAEKEVTSNA